MKDFGMRWEIIKENQWKIMIKVAQAVYTVLKFSVSPVNIRNLYAGKWIIKC